jgi:hypothetical protein
MPPACAVKFQERTIIARINPAFGRLCERPILVLCFIIARLEIAQMRGRLCPCFHGKQAIPTDKNMFNVNLHRVKRECSEKCGTPKMRVLIINVAAEVCHTFLNTPGKTTCFAVR